MVICDISIKSKKYQEQKNIKRKLNRVGRKDR